MSPLNKIYVAVAHIRETKTAYVAVIEHVRPIRYNRPITLFFSSDKHRPARQLCVPGGAPIYVGVTMYAPPYPPPPHPPRSLC